MRAAGAHAWGPFDRLRANGGLAGRGGGPRLRRGLRQAQGERGGVGAHACGGALRRAQGERRARGGGGGPCLRRGPSTGSGRTGGAWGAAGAHACGVALRQAQGERRVRGASGGGPCLRGPFDRLRANGVWGRGGPFGGLWAERGKVALRRWRRGGLFRRGCRSWCICFSYEIFVPKFAPVRNNPPAVRARTAGCRLCGRCGRGSSRRGGGGWGLLWGRRGGRRV